MSDDEFKQRMAEVSAEFRADLPARISGIDALWVQITHGEHSPQRMADLILAVHKIAGSAETFGLAAVGQAAAAAEARLELLRDALLPPDVAAQGEITLLLDTLRHAVAGQP
jgi:hypothetical protein